MLITHPKSNPVCSLGDAPLKLWPPKTQKSPAGCDHRGLFPTPANGPGLPSTCVCNARTESLVPAPQLRAAPNFKRALAKFLARGIEFKADECAKHHDN